MLCFADVFICSNLLFHAALFHVQFFVLLVPAPLRIPSLVCGRRNSLALVQQRPVLFVDIYLCRNVMTARNNNVITPLSSPGGTVEREKTSIRRYVKAILLPILCGI